MRSAASKTHCAASSPLPATKQVKPIHGLRAETVSAARLGRFLFWSNSSRRERPVNAVPRRPKAAPQILDGLSGKVESRLRRRQSDQCGSEWYVREAPFISGRVFSAGCFLRASAHIRSSRSPFCVSLKRPRARAYPRASSSFSIDHRS